MGSFERETAAFAKIIAERAPKPREPRAPSSWLCEDRAGASHFRDVDGCEDVDSFLASGFARYLSLSAVSRFEGRVCDARSHGYKPQGIPSRRACHSSTQEHRQDIENESEATRRGLHLPNLSTDHS